MTSKLITFLNNSVSPYHCVDECVKLLKKSGYKKLSESHSMKLSEGRGRGYYIIRDGSSIISFYIPKGFKKSKDKHCVIIGAHTDSPVLKLKLGGCKNKSKYLTAAVEIYGGVLLSTWFDRDLSIAGRVILKKNGKLTTKLLNVKKSIAKISNLAIHLNHQVNQKGFAPNKQKEMNPILAANLSEHFDFNKYLLDEFPSTAKDTLVSYDLNFYDAQAASLNGIKNEFISSARLDNLAMCHATLMAQINQQKPANMISVTAFFDNEEVGSSSLNGAGSDFLLSTLNNIFCELKESSRMIFSRSLFISSDMAHAAHPSYIEKHDDSFRPIINKGPVLKINENQRYTTDAIGTAIFKTICEKQKIPYQIYYNRNDLPCGSTIGPITSAKLGIRSIDIGNSMFAMHSIRETSGAKDHKIIVKLFQSFFSEQYYSVVKDIHD